MSGTGVLRASPCHCKAHIKLSCRWGQSVNEDPRSDVQPRFPDWGLWNAKCLSMLLRKCCLWRKRSRYGQMSLKEERQMSGEMSCKRFILVLARRFWTRSTRAEVKSSGCLVLQGLQPAKGSWVHIPYNCFVQVEEDFENNWNFFFRFFSSIFTHFSLKCLLPLQ